MHVYLVSQMWCKKSKLLWSVTFEVGLKHDFINLLKLLF